MDIFEYIRSVCTLPERIAFNDLLCDYIEEEMKDNPDFRELIKARLSKFELFRIEKIPEKIIIREKDTQAKDRIQRILKKFPGEEIIIKEGFIIIPRLKRKYPLYLQEISFTGNYSGGVKYPDNDRKLEKRKLSHKIPSRISSNPFKYALSEYEKENGNFFPLTIKTSVSPQIHFENCYIWENGKEKYIVVYDNEKELPIFLLHRYSQTIIKRFI